MLRLGLFVGVVSLVAMAILAGNRGNHETPPADESELSLDDRFVTREGTLSLELSEISGWVFVNDSTLIAHNDSGNEAALFVLNIDGTIRHKAIVKGTGNVDFEDIAADGKGFLYLADFGNNHNLRRDLAIYRIRVADVVQKDTVRAQSIAFIYEDQQAFPPEKEERYYDAEAIACYNDSLHIFTKCRTEPFDGKSQVYALPTEPGSYPARLEGSIITGTRGWLKDAVTAADEHKGKLYLLSYTRLWIYTLDQNKAPVLEQTIRMTPISQKEALAVHRNGKVYVADERRKFIGGGNIFVVNPSANTSGK